MAEREAQRRQYDYKAVRPLSCNTTLLTCCIDLQKRQKSP